MSPRPAHRFDALLLIAVLVAIAVALSGIVSEAQSVPGDAVALVNGRAISRTDFRAMLDVVEKQMKRTLDAAEKQEALQRFIEEELLLQQAQALDLPHKDGRIRGLLVQQMMQQAVAGATHAAPDEAMLRQFHAQHTDYFRRPASYRVRQYNLPDMASATQLLAASVDLHALARWASARDNYLPDEALPEAKLHDYLGAGPTARIMRLGAGAGFAQAQSNGSVRVYVLLGVTPGATPAFDEMRAQVESEYLRQRDEAALRDHVERLRREASIETTTESLP